MKRAWLIVLAACGAPPRPPTVAPIVAVTSPITGPIARDAIPGLRWGTPQVPWRTPDAVEAILEVPGDPSVVLLASRSWLGVMDLSTGTIRTQRRFEDVRSIVQLPDGRVVAFSVEQGRNHGTFIDPATLATTRELDISPAAEKQPLDAIVTPTGDLVAALPGQPLAMLDQETLQPVRELSAFVGTWNLQATPTSILFVRNNPGYRPEPRESSSSIYAGLSSNRPIIDEEVFYRPGGTRTMHATIVAARGDTVVSYETMRYASGLIQKGKRPIEMKTLGRIGALDRSAYRLASIDDGVMMLFSTADGSEVSRIALGDHDIGGYSDRAAFVGDRVVLAFHNQVRVVDLAAKTTSSAPIAPLGAIESVAVANTGDVETLGHDHVLYRGGRAVSSEIIDGKTFAVEGGSVGTYAIYEEDRLVSPPDYRRKGSVTWFVDGKHESRMNTDTNTSIDGWSGHDALVLRGMPGGYVYEDYAFVALSGDRTPRIRTVWQDNVGWFDLYPDVSPLAIDPDTRTAVVRYPEGPRVVDLMTGNPTAALLPCAPAAEMEHGGARIALSGTDAITVVDRETFNVSATIDVHGMNEGNGVNVQFLMGRDEVLLRYGDHLAFWTATTKQLRVAQIAGITALATSPDGHQLAIAFEDARVALVDFDAFLASLPVSPAATVAAPSSECPTVER